MNFLDSANIIHRDIKPSNILIDPKTLEIKLCDFGLSRSDPESLPKAPTPYCKNMRKEAARELIASRPKREKRKRALSNHIATRSYRAPEVILQEPQYGTSVDMWALGCILLEILFQSKDYSEEKKSKPTSYKNVFGGSSCYPLSPRVSSRTGKVKEDKNDQLRVILNTLGDQSDEDVSFITNLNAIHYMK